MSFGVRKNGIPEIAKLLSYIRSGQYKTANEKLLDYESSFPKYKAIWSSYRRILARAADSDSDIFDDAGLKEESLFDSAWYSRKYDIPENVNPLNHYRYDGWKKRYDPSPFFCTSSYLDSEIGLVERLINLNQNPLWHYCITGHAESRSLFHNPLSDFSRRYRPSSETHFIRQKKKAKVHAGRKISAVVHCYYPEIADVILDECLSRGLTVYASLTQDVDFRELLVKYRGKVCFKTFINRGRDIAPFITGFKDEIGSSDLCIHLHTKKSLHYGIERNDWMGYCLESLLSNIHEIIELFDSDNDTAMIFPDPPAFLRSQINWGHNFNRARSIVERLGLSLDPGDRLDFPAGSMFWFRPKYFSELFSLPLSAYHFEKEASQVDGTLAHAFERVFGVFCLKTKRKMIPVRLEKSAYFEFVEYQKDGYQGKMEATSAYKPQYNLALKQFYPELTPYSFEKSPNRRERVNLIVPTIDPAHVFGGIATALRFFECLLQRTGFDGRIIVSDGASSIAMASLYPDYSFYKLSACDDTDDRQILSTNERHLGSLPVRSNDIFIATAWWTAHHLKEIERYQVECFVSRRKHVYLVQDYEPGFYGWSSKTILAKDTYKNTWCNVYNTQLLYDFCESLEMRSGPIMAPYLNDSIEHALRENAGKAKEKIIVIYGRPFAERNCNEILLEAISRFREKCDPNRHWRVISLGQMYVHSLHSSLDVEVLGKASLSDYADLLARSFIGISLMVSPHPSYPPYEMLAGGLFVYTNRYMTKQRICNSDKLTMGDGSPTDIVEFLAMSIRQYAAGRCYDVRDLEFDVGGGLDMKTCVSAVAQECCDIAPSDSPVTRDY
jgi:hypothetical protein